MVKFTLAAALALLSSASAQIYHPADPTVVLSPWKTGTGPTGFQVFPFPIGLPNPSLPSIDYNLTTTWTSSGGSLKFLLNYVDNYQGFYVQAAPGQGVPAIGIKVYNEDWTVSWDAANFAGSPDDFALIRFKDDLGVEGTINTHYFALTWNASLAWTVADIFPIYEGETIIEP